MKIKRSSPLKRQIRVPGDKSISHRAVMFGAISQGTTQIENFLSGADCLSTIACFEKMGIKIERKENTVTVHGKGLHGLKAPEGELDCGNSGTTMRLMSGILAAQDFDSVMTGDASLRKRPMRRVTDPLGLMGASIETTDGCAPLHVHAAHLKGIEFYSPVASAQVKSALLLAGLYADGITKVKEPALSRNHTELMLKSFGAEIESDTENLVATVKPAKELYGTKIVVPGDISSAAYAMVAGLIVPGSEILLENVGINPTRCGIIEVLKKMGGNIELLNVRGEGEKAADILVRYSMLHGVKIEGAIIPTLIDELPVIAIAAAAAEGTTVIADASELRVKESDRIETVTQNLRAMGGDITPTEDGMIIKGGAALRGALIKTQEDHRIAMSFTVAGLIADGETEIDDPGCAVISYPDFYSTLM
ncbi:MAG: 3-phosphoshikimate 1-carboxyvinyltransferase [Lachnospiraceae bacterium]|nr:3-phosphoshikimate 1-carboxyvinyltransferase [Lachnospiraceae bacterium]